MYQPPMCAAQVARRRTSRAAVAAATTGPDESGAREIAELYAAVGDLARLARHTVGGCDGAGLSLLTPDELVTVAASDRLVDPLDAAQYRAGDGPCLHAVRTGTIVRVDDFASDRRWPQVSAEALVTAVRASLSLPIRDSGRVLGVLNLYGHQPNAFSSGALEPARAVTDHAAAVLGYVRRYQRERDERGREHEIAEALQRGLLPTLAPVRGLQVAARYLSSSAADSVGGDWYDLFALPDGAVGLAIGDVMGHDVAAAAAMGQLRSVLRSYAYEGGSPAKVLDRMDRLVQGFDMAQLATALYGRLVLDRAGGLLRYANAGHLPPLVRHLDGGVQFLDRARSALIGAPLGDSTERAETAVGLRPGDILLLYTDGLVEDRRRPLDRGLALLERLCAEQPPQVRLETLCDALVAGLGAERSEDDVAVLAVRLLPSS